MLLFSPAEEALVNNIFDELGPQDDILLADQATSIFLKSGLHHRVLASIWDIADETAKGYLIRREVAIALRLIGWAQLGRAITAELVNVEGPLAVFDQNARNPSIRVGSRSGQPQHETSWNFQLRSLSSENKANYQTVYFQAGPHHGVLSAQKVWQILLRSQLPSDSVEHVWRLVDTQNRGDLDAVEFTIAMHIVHSMVQQELSTIPSSLPPWIYEQAGGKPPRAGDLQSNRDGMNRAFVADFWTLQFHPEDNMTLERISKLANRYFDLLDKRQQGYIEGDDVVSFMSLSKLPLTDLGRIWDIADPDQRGHLDRDAFAHALLLIYRKLAGIEPQPTSPPPSFEQHETRLPRPSPGTDAPLLSPPPTFRSRQSSNASMNSPPPPPPPLRPRKSSTTKPGQQDEVERLVQENRMLRTQSMVIPDATTKLLAEIGELRTMISNLNHENNRLQHSQPSSSSSSSKPPGKKRKGRKQFLGIEGDLSDELIFDELWKEVQEKDATIAFLRESLDRAEETTRQNALLQEQVDDLQREIQTLRMDQDTVRHMLNEEAQRELEVLRRQVDELRQSTAQVPSSGGDDELQMLINEELSRENSTLRSKVNELQESLAQLQRLSSEQDDNRRAAEEMTRRYRRLQRRLEEAANQHSRVEQQLNSRVEELEQELGTLRQHTADDHQDGHVPPPAYTETA